MKITWEKCQSYEYAKAKNYSDVIYLHEWKEQPFYWGKVGVDSDFGTHYGPSYSHWIEGCLRHGACLFIGTLDEEARKHIDDLENYLICKYPSVMNRKIVKPKTQINFEHKGNIPDTISSQACTLCIKDIATPNCC